MSRIGKQPIYFNEATSVLFENSSLTVTGAKGELTITVPPELGIEISGSTVRVSVKKQSKDVSALWGLTRSLVNNMVTGVSDLFVKRLLLVGPGYKSAVQGGYLVLRLGFSHDIIYAFPKLLSIQCPKENVVEILGCDKQLVGQVVAEIRSFRKPEPYKGKGVKYDDEIIVRKKGKESKK